MEFTGLTSASHMSLPEAGYGSEEGYVGSEISGAVSGVTTPGASRLQASQLQQRSTTMQRLQVRNNLEASIGTHEDKFRQLRRSIHELRDELVGLSREHTIKHEPINSASPSSIAALTLDVSNLQREVAAVRLAIEGWEHEGVDEAKEFSDDESFQVCSSERSGGHANCTTRSFESLSSAFYGRGQDNASKYSSSAPCAAKKKFLGVVDDNFRCGDGERYTPSIFFRPRTLHRNITQGKLPTLDVPKPSMSGICRDVKSGEKGILGTMFPYGSHSLE